MKSTSNHIIHKQTIDIRFLDFTTARNWDAAAQAKIAEALRNCIERCFEDYDSTREYLTIDKLEFDLGSFSADQLESKMPEKFYGELQKILNSYRVNLHDVEGGKVADDVSSINVWSAPGTEQKIADPIVRNSDMTALLYFLQLGYLPWWYRSEPNWNLEWIQELTDENWKELRNYLIVRQVNDFNNEPGLLRLISQFSDEFLANLLNGLQLKEPVEKAWSWIKGFHEMLQGSEINSFRTEESLPSLSVLRVHFWKNWIRYAIGKSEIPELTTLFVFINQPVLIVHLLSKTAEKDEWIESIPEFWHDELISYKQKMSGSESELNKGHELAINTAGEKIKGPVKASRIDKEDFILIPDSGLVLLHPFLPRLFEHCGWLNKNEFLNDEARNRAVNTLHYLATGDEEFPEYVLMLPKLLCGIPIEWPLEPTLPLDDAEKAACNELLVQVIGHWSALRNASPTALLETFLRRQGKLFSTDKGWRLEVQRRTEDILVDRLPRGFSMIKYSWMPQILSVAWE